MEDEILAQPMADATSNDAPSVSETSDDTLSSEESVAEALSAIYRKNNSQETAPEEKVEQDVAEKEIEGNPLEEGTKEAATPPISHPITMPSELQAEWAAVPPKIQEWMSKRETEAQQAISRLGNEVSVARPILQSVEPVASRHGVQPQEAVTRLLAANEFLEQDPIGGIQWLAEAFNVDLAALVGLKQEGSNPQFEALSHQVQQLKQQNMALQRSIDQTQQQTLQQKTSTINSLIDKYSKNEPFWGDIESDIVAQIHAVRAINPSMDEENILKQAIENAKHVNANVRLKIDQQKQQEEARELEEQERSKKAKKIAQMNVKSNGSGANSDVDTETLLRSIYRKHQS